MGRHILIELGWLSGGLLLAFGITWGAAWGYPLGQDVIWSVGGVAMIIVVLVNLRAIRDARAKDRTDG